MIPLNDIMMFVVVVVVYLSCAAEFIGIGFLILDDLLTLI